MKVNFEFSNLIGSVYRGGELLFLPDGNTLLSPVGNKISLFDLKNDRSETLPIEARFNIGCVAVNSTATNALLVTESSEALYVSLVSRRVLHRHRFGLRVHCAKFSPDDRRLAVCRERDVQLIQAPGVFTHAYSPFLVEHTYRLAHDHNTCLDWADDSRVFVCGSRDGSSRVCAAEPNSWANLHHINTMAGHAQPLVAVAFLANDAYDLMSVCRGGKLVVWTCDFTGADLRRRQHDDEEVKTEDDADNKPFKWIKHAKHNYATATTTHQALTCAAYNRQRQLLVAGFSAGLFVLHEMPDFNLIHSLTASDEARIESVCLNASADWIGLGAEGGRLLVWEWQSETYVMKQQAHAQRLTCVQFSPDGWRLATAAEDASVKLWSVMSGLCEATFTEHTGAVRALAWTQQGRALLSAASDGTVRAADVKKLHTFRTLVCPRPSQLSCVCVDGAGEVVCAGASNVFDVFVWSLQTGRLLDVLSGHESPVSSVAFNPAEPVLASVAWDKTLRVWQLFAADTAAETIALPAEGLDVSFAPSGQSVSALTSDSKITSFDWKQNQQLWQIEAHMDIDPSRAEGDVITGKKSGASKSVTRFSYSPDGQYILCGGQSKFVCLYSTHDQLLVNKFRITANFSLSAVADDVDRRRVSEFGNTHLFDVSDESDGDLDDEAARRRKPASAVRLPGVKATNQGDRRVRPEIRVHDVAYSPTGRCWAACTTEGLLLYSLDRTGVFEPQDLLHHVTPDSVRQAILTGEHSSAVCDALRLNQPGIIEEAVNSTPMTNVRVLVHSLPCHLVVRLLVWLADVMASSSRLHCHALWLRHALEAQGNELKQDAARVMPCLTQLLQTLQRKQTDLEKVCAHNAYSLSYLLNVPAVKADVS